ncbi:MAG: hypothetical protein KJO77_00095 [Bacteroidia bacterium]|nr:hypothetical protein [Bacteroidia bacterium]
MIKFFRRFRQQLLSENKFRKYVLYAVGEIILVVIGILIALQINNWNQNQKLKKEETKLLKGLHAEFSENLVKFDSNYKNQLNRDQIIKRLLDPKTVEAPFETLDSLIYFHGWNFKFNPSTGIYNSVINSGKIDLISDDSLKIAISKFNNYLVDFEEEEEGANYYGTNFMTPYMRSQLYYRFPFQNRTAEQRHYDDINYREVIQSDRTRNELIFYWSYLLITLEEGQELRHQIVSIIKMIENELRQ